MPRPVLDVLAGGDDAGKRSIGGYLLQREGLTSFNPDTLARELNAATGCGQESANAYAWHESLWRLDQAVMNVANFAFETTLGVRTVATRILAATRTHAVHVWFCGLATPERHIARVRARVAARGPRSEDRGPRTEDMTSRTRRFANAIPAPRGT